MKEVTIEVPEKEPTARTAGPHNPDEHRTVSLKDGLSIAFADNEARVYDPNWDRFIQLSYEELITILGAAYESDFPQNNGQ